MPSFHFGAGVTVEISPVESLVVFAFVSLFVPHSGNVPWKQPSPFQFVYHGNDRKQHWGSGQSGEGSIASGAAKKNTNKNLKFSFMIFHFQLHLHQQTFQICAFVP